MALKDDPKLRGPRMGGELAKEIGVSGATARRMRGLLLDGRGNLRKVVGPDGSLVDRSPDAGVSDLA